MYKNNGGCHLKIESGCLNSEIKRDIFSKNMCIIVIMQKSEIGNCY